MERITVQFPEELLAQIDERALILARDYNVRMKRSGIIRMLIENALKADYPYGGPEQEESRITKA